MLQERVPRWGFWIKAQDVCIQTAQEARNVRISLLPLHERGMGMLSLGQRGFHISQQKFPAEGLLNPPWHPPSSCAGTNWEVLLREKTKGKLHCPHFSCLKGCWLIPVLKLQVLWLLGLNGWN